MKQYIVFAGVNGAGKTTLYQTYPLLQKMPRVNVDEIVRKFGDWRNSGDVTRAGIIAVRNIKSLMEEGVSFNQETTLCGKSILRNIRLAKEKGYQVILYYVGLDSADTAKKRIAQRVLNGGHGIPDADVERRYKESIQNLIEIIPFCDRVEVFDNSQKFRQVAVIKKGIITDVAEEVPAWCSSILSL